MNARQQKYYDILVILAESRGYKVLGIYINNITKIKMRCPEGHETEIAPVTFKLGPGCRKCSGYCREQAEEDFYKQAKERGYQIIGEYINNKTKVKMICPNGHEIEITPDNFKHGKNCGTCSINSTEKAKESFYKLAKERNFQIIGQYINAYTKIKMICPDGHEIEMTPHDFKSGNNCLKCSNQCPGKAEEILVKIAFERNFEIIEKYINAYTKVKMRCPNKHVCYIRPSCFRRGRGCNICNLSGIAFRISQILDELDINYIIEEKILVEGLRYDFYLYEHNCVIEVDGEQHFHMSEHFSDTEQDFVKRRQRDIIKFQQCKNKQIKMIRLDYKWIPKNDNKAIAIFIQKSLDSDKKIICSTPDMYTWLYTKLDNIHYKQYNVKPPYKLYIDNVLITNYIEYKRNNKNL